jgi:hypothetical protein
VAGGYPGDPDGGWQTGHPDRSWTRDDLMRIEPVDISAGHAGWLAEPRQL